MDIEKYLGKYVVLTGQLDIVYIMRLVSIREYEIYNDICYCSTTKSFYKDGGKWGHINNINHIRLATINEIKECLHITHKINYYEIY